MSSRSASARRRTRSTPKGRWSRPATCGRRPIRSNAAARRFTGEIEQVPPVYSALKIEGKAAYERARAGEDVELKSRKITVFELRLHETTPDSATFHARVSKGTYIRSLARDIARR